MESRILDNRIPDFSEYKLLASNFHDIHSITPFHVTVIKTIASVIDIDPTTQELNLADSVSISCLDKICDKDSTCYKEVSAVSFFYNWDDSEYFIVAKSTGEVLIYQE